MPNLQEVVVEAPAIQVKEDTIEYRADAFKVKEGAAVEDPENYPGAGWTRTETLPPRERV